MLFHLIIAVSAIASSVCGPIQKNNGSIAQSLEQQEQLMQQLNASTKNIEAQCQAKQTEIAKTGAKTATSESCVSFREQFVMNDNLTRVSETCRASVEEARQQMFELSRTYIAPEQIALGEVTELDQGLTRLQKKCGAELGETKMLSGRTQELLKQSVAQIQRTEKAVQNYVALGAETKKFRDLNGAHQARCVASSGQTTAANPVAHGGAKDPKPVPTGRSVSSPSTITGNVHKEELPR